MQASRLEWRKSSRSGKWDADCVEVTVFPRSSETAQQEVRSAR